MAEKIELEKPVVSKGLAERFEHLKDQFNRDVLKIIDSCLYIYKEIPEYQRLNNTSLENLLARMYVLGYEVEKPKHYVLKLPDLDIDGTIIYLCKDCKENPIYRLEDANESLLYYIHSSDGFTKEEIEADEGLNKLAGACELVEVGD